MKCYFFFSQEHVYSASAESEIEAIEKIKNHLPDGKKQDFEDAVSEKYNKKQAVPPNGMLLI